MALNQRSNDSGLLQCLRKFKNTKLSKKNDINVTLCHLCTSKISNKRVHYCILLERNFKRKDSKIGYECHMNASSNEIALKMWEKWYKWHITLGYCEKKLLFKLIVSLLSKYLSISTHYHLFGLVLNVLVGTKTQDADNKHF